MSIVAVLIRLISTKASRWKKASQCMPIHRKGKNIDKCFANESCLESKEKTLKHIKKTKNTKKNKKNQKYKKNSSL
jgi:hypothetical protein